MSAVMTTPHVDSHVALDFSRLLVDPATIGARAPRGLAAIPTVVDPDPMRPVLASNHEPLVPFVADERLHVVPAYADQPGGSSTLLARTGVADRVTRASRMLPDGFGLAVLDAWRPLDLQQHIYDVAYANLDLPPGFVTAPSTDPTTPPPHLTGGTVDVTLTWRGTPLALGTGFDDFTDLAHLGALERTLDPSRDLRRLLFWTMRAVDFTPIWCEWWHFEYGTRRWATDTTGGRDTDPIYGAARP